ncbi:MAG: HU family DNA-binding protein [Dysgonamonadaceae bacterium]|jgi:predicted histone-like DNA-binding protein|nr:HU family DNA-binding protein [Dysgonamonadaceae bacterium]
MSVFYNKVERGNPMNLSAGKKWYAVLKTISQIGEKDVAKLISEETTLNRKEAEMALDQFEKILLRLLLDGHSVQLGDWGSFHLTCNSKPSDTKQEVVAGNVQNLNIRFTPGKELKAAIQKAELIYSETIVS